MKCSSNSSIHFVHYVIEKQMHDEQVSLKFYVHTYTSEEPWAAETHAITSTFAFC